MPYRSREVEGESLSDVFSQELSLIWVQNKRFIFQIIITSAFLERFLNGILPSYLLYYLIKNLLNEGDEHAFILLYTRVTMGI